MKDMYHSYFVKHIASSQISSLQILLCTFILSCICDGHKEGQLAVLRSEAPRVLRSNLDHRQHRVRQWSCLCFGKLWHNNHEVKQQLMHINSPPLNKLCSLALSDTNPEVRACATYALGTFFGCHNNEATSENTMMTTTGHAQVYMQELQLSRALSPLVFDASPLVRLEYGLALTQLVLVHKQDFLRYGFGITMTPSHPHTRSPLPTSGHGHDMEVEGLCRFLGKVVRQLCRDSFHEVAGAAGALIKRMSRTYSYERVLNEATGSGDRDMHGSIGSETQAAFDS